MHGALGLIPSTKKEKLNKEVCVCVCKIQGTQHTHLSFIITTIQTNASEFESENILTYFQRASDEK
jgi:hypothetical protein